MEVHNEKNSYVGSFSYQDGRRKDMVQSPPNSVLSTLIRVARDDNKLHNLYIFKNSF